MESSAGAAGTLKVIMNGWYSASQEIVFWGSAPIREISLCNLCVLCVSVVIPANTTTETQRTQRLHREAVQIRSPSFLGLIALAGVLRRISDTVCAASSGNLTD